MLRIEIFQDDRLKRRLTSVSQKLNWNAPAQRLILDLTRQDESEKLGIGIVGGADVIEEGKPSGVFIKTIRSDGLAARDGRLEVYDEIVRINGVSMDGVTHQGALQLFSRPGRKLVLEILRRMRAAPKVLTLESAGIGETNVDELTNIEEAEITSAAHEEPQAMTSRTFRQGILKTLMQPNGTPEEKQAHEAHKQDATRLFADVFGSDPESPTFSLAEYMDKVRYFNRSTGWESEKVSLAWKDLTIESEGHRSDEIATVASKISVRLPHSSAELLPKREVDKISGFVNSGEMLLFLGTPDSGCTTAMKALAGKLPKDKYDISGSINYNGEPGPGRYRPRVRYVDEDDRHLAALSVDKTLRFAANMTTPMEHPFREESIDTFINVIEHVLGIHHVRFSPVGNDLLRGVSGGERKRVTIAEMILARGPVVFLDNFTKGLDASAALDVVKAMRLASRVFGVCFIATQFQASQDIFAMYDNVCLMKEGRCIYFGPPTSALGYFEELGFVCPSRRTVPDFLATLGDSEMHQDEGDMDIPADDATQYLAMRPGGLEVFETPKSAKPMAGVMIPQGSLFGVSQTCEVVGVLFLRAHAGWVCAGSLEDSSFAEPVHEKDLVLFGRKGASGFINGVYVPEIGRLHAARPVFKRRGGVPIGENQTADLFLYYHEEICAWVLGSQVGGGRPVAVNESKVSHPSALRTPWKIEDPKVWGMFRADPTVRIIQMNPAPITAEELSYKFAKSAFQQKINENIPLAVTPPPANMSIEFKSFTERNYALGFGSQVRLLVDREYDLLSKDRRNLKTRFGRFIILGLVVGALFWNMGLDNKGLYNRAGVLFFSTILVGMSSFGFLPEILERRTVFYKQKGAYFFTPAAYFVGSLLADIPLMLLETLVFSNCLYWMAGLNTGDNGMRYFFFLCMLFAANFSLSNFVRMMANTTSNLSSAQVASAGSVVLFILFCGYLIPRESIPPYFIWIHYLSPFKYVVEGLFMNEYDGLVFTTLVGSQLSGAAYLELNYDMSASDVTLHKWMMFLAVLGFGVFFMLMSMLGLSKLTFGSSSSAARIMYARKKRRTKEAMSEFVRHGSTAPVPPGSNPNIKSSSSGLVTGSASTLARMPKNTSLKSRSLQSHSTAQTNSRTNTIASQASNATSGKWSNLATMRSADISIDMPANNNPVSGAHLTWQNLSYDIDLPAKRGEPRKRRTLLNKVSGYVKPGTLCALMGASGAGKTTLLDVLARRKTGGHVTGNIMVNGMEQGPDFRRISGYVEQSDMHAPRATVREAIMFSAVLRLPPDMSRQEKKARMLETAELLGLTPLLDAVIGSDDLDGAIFPDARKRVTIAVELVANPSILFMDEPTSGLNSSAALTVMKAARRVADTNRAVICTIHQPSAELFEMFDNLLLLQKGGLTAYFGPIGKESQTLLSYFEENGAPPAAHQVCMDLRKGCTFDLTVASLACFLNLILFFFLP